MLVSIGALLWAYVTACFVVRTTAPPHRADSNRHRDIRHLGGARRGRRWNAAVLGATLGSLFCSLLFLP
eukprot:6108548-Pleurochrysis_carterae.AAC.1